jgi:hypothetical protein
LTDELGSEKKVGRLLETQRERQEKELDEEHKRV